MSRRLLLSFLASSVAACATAPSELLMSTAPSDRVYAWQKAAPGFQRLVVTRDAAGSPACGMDTLIDGSRVAHLKAGETAVFHLWSGTHTVAVAGVAPCAAALAEVSVRVEAGAVEVVRIMQDEQGAASIGPAVALAKR